MFDFLASKPAAPATPAVPVETIAPNGPASVDPQAAGVTVPSVSTPQPLPLDEFKDMYKLEVPKEGEVTGPPRISITNEALDQVTAQLDFMADLPTEVAAGLQTGDPASIVKAIQHAGAQAYRKSMQHQSALVNDNMDARFDAFAPTIDKSVNTNLTNQALGALPNANNPVVKAELTRISAALQKKYPTAGPDWISQQTSKYLVELGAQLNPQSTQPQSELPQEVDFATLVDD